jgi:hypothetical protein
VIIAIVIALAVVVAIDSIARLPRRPTPRLRDPAITTTQKIVIDLNDRN